MCVSQGTAIGITISSVSVMGIRETQHVGVISLGRSRSIRVRMELMTGMKAMRGRSKSWLGSGSERGEAIVRGEGVSGVVRWVGEGGDVRLVQGNRGSWLRGGVAWLD
jgi:hypothetical protein